MHRWDHHPPCPGGCGDLADECGCAQPNPLGSMRIVEPAPNYVALLDAQIAKAQTEARRQHEAGTCHLSEWSCSHCEDDDEADRDKWLGEAHTAAPVGD